jgi:hypothetical protein
MKGETVIVRAYGNEPLVRRVWATTEHGVFICTNENFDDLDNGRKALNPVGFHWEDVFEYDEVKLRALERGYKEKPALWNRMTVWTGETNGSG